jgi:hypothetical protein
MSSGTALVIYWLRNREQLDMRLRLNARNRWCEATRAGDGAYVLRGAAFLERLRCEVPNYERRQG